MWLFNRMLQRTSKINTLFKLVPIHKPWKEKTIQFLWSNSKVLLQLFQSMPPPLQFVLINLITNEAWTGHICHPGNVFPIVFNFIANLSLLKWIISFIPSGFYPMPGRYFIWYDQTAILVLSVIYLHESYNIIIEFLEFLFKNFFSGHILWSIIEYLNFIDLLLVINLLFYMKLFC